MEAYIDKLPRRRLDSDLSKLWETLLASSQSGFDANTKANAEALYDWLYAGYDFDQKMVFLDGAGPDSNTVIVTVPGEEPVQVYTRVPDKGVELLKIFYDNYGDYIDSNDIMKFKDMPQDEKGISRIILSIPSPLRQMIKSKRGKGRYLLLP
jgi:hypothetical protein